MTITLEALRGAKTPEEAHAGLMDVLGTIARQLDNVTARGDGDGAKLEVHDKSITDLRGALAEVKASLGAEAMRDLQGPEAELRSFVGKDGRIRWTGRATSEELWQDGLLDTERDLGDWHVEAKRLHGALSLARVARGAGTGRDGDAPKIQAAYRAHMERAPGIVKRAIFGDSSNDAFIPTQNLVPDLDRDLRIVAEGSIASQFPVVPMSSKVITYPFASAGGTPYLQGAAVSDPAQFTASLPGDDARSHTAKTLAMRYEMDRDSTEDAIIDSLAEFSLQMAYDLTDGEEDAILNGDTTASHGDTGIAAWNPNGRWGGSSWGGTADHRRAWIGLRHRALDIGATAALDMGSLQTFDGVAQLRSMLAARYGRATIGICSEKWLYLKVLTMDEVQKTDSAVGTAGADGRVLTLAGIPLFTSLFMDDQLNASGIYDNSIKTKSGLVLVNKMRFRRYLRRGARVEIATDITRGKLDIVGTWRGTFKTNDADATRNVVYGYNLG